VWLFWKETHKENKGQIPSTEARDVVLKSLGSLVLGMIMGGAVGWLGSGLIIAVGRCFLGLFFEAPNEIGGITWLQALRYSAESMAFQKPDFVHLEQGLSPLRVWTWVQSLVGPFLFVMFGLALKNKLKR